MGNVLELDHVTAKSTHIGTTNKGQIQYAASGMKGWRVTMEDCHTLCDAIPIDHTAEMLENHSLFAVYDGHGGALTSLYAGENFIRIFSKQHEVRKYVALPLKGNKSREDVIGIELLKNALKRTFVALDAELRIVQHKKNEEFAREDEKQEEKRGSMIEDTSVRRVERSGSTCNVVLITPSHFICANAGDSRAILRRDGKSLPLSFDHKPSNLPELERITTAGGFVKSRRINGDLAVSRGLGDFVFKCEPEIAINKQKVICDPEIIVYPRDEVRDEFLVLACDGIWDVMSNEQCSDMIQKILVEGETKIDLVCEEVLDMCLERNSRDNMTLIMVCLPGIKMRKSAFGSNAVQMRRTARRARLLETQAKLTAKHTAKRIGLDFGLSPKANEEVGSEGNNVAMNAESPSVHQRSLFK
mmetsp:Transcript_2540/g.3744  ORF Transcript_2540/g.3744 Transcript_2540/m.3744 type:complete len:415 (-) Transcript_2540:262-1506(-)|eukprot:CAMPEP_0194220652 /NCGR_PEP_ID=MMETSP0156-20130528/28898_1 /TAXON_ID=33649 /ORGANISM="Thalassionema nitzschioides, Strain L26-B" /LENGTH=414 /DNA_ID=CAMNT_0038950771 /DNA_START=253 /DNA_END=1497 /DNA_ORIENTATION=-